MSVHAFGYVAETAQRARDDFYPGYARLMSTLGRERGWSPPSRAQFDAACSPMGPFMVGGPEEVAQKVAFLNETLGGLSRVTFQMTNVLLPHARMLHAIELLGTTVRPQVQAHLGTTGELAPN